MDLTLTNGQTSLTLCTDAARSTGGSPVGPGNLSFVETPGVETREFVGADRVAMEHVRCNHGTLTFQATRVFDTAAAAAAYALTGHLAEICEGALKYGESTIFSNASVTSRRVGMVGQTVVVTYTIEG